MEPMNVHLPRSTSKPEAQPESEVVKKKSASVKTNV